MFGNFKKDKSLEFALKPVEDHVIPYACHYDNKSLLTKNGELMQVLRIEGYSKEMMNTSVQVDLRSIIRHSITENIKDRKVALWFHTIRRKINLDSINYFSSTFAKDTHESWAKKNYWRNKFVNELYITILYEGAGHGNPALTFTPKLLKEHHLKVLQEHEQKLDEVVLKMLEVLKPYGGKRLEVAHDSVGAHSEILEFLTKIICLHSERVPLPVQSIDNVFLESNIAFGGTSIEVLNKNKKRFAAVFSFKEYHEFAAKALDRFMSIAAEYIISQTLTFVEAKEAKKTFEYFNYILSVSKDAELRENCGLASTLDGDLNGSTDYGTQQMNFMIVAESLEELDGSVSRAIKELNKLGVRIIREDLNIELGFWSQLPGNFKFFRRPSYIRTNKSASFASLNNNPSGKTDNIWGSAVTLFRRNDGGPHFFNFHVDNIGHTLIAGPGDSVKKTLVNFLLSESTKYNPEVLYIDQFPNSQVTIKLLEGKYATISVKKEAPAFKFNPFKMPDNSENREFLKNWILLLLATEDVLTEEQNQKIFDYLDVFFSQVPVEMRQISMLAEFFEDEVLKDKLLLWCNPNKLGLLFDNSWDDLDNGTKLIGLNIEELVIDKNNSATNALIAYCLYKYSIMHEEQPYPPTMIIIDDANLLMQNDYFTKMLPALLSNLTIKNIMVIFVCMIDHKKGMNSVIKNIHEHLATKLLLPCLDYKLYKESFSLDTEEVKALSTMKIIHRNFMIKQKALNMIVELNLDGLVYAIAALEGENGAVQAMEMAIAENGDNPNVWVVPFYNYLFPQLQQ